MLPMHQQRNVTPVPPPLRPRRRLTNTAACPLPPSHPNSAAVQALRCCHPDNATERPPLLRPLSLPAATACHCRLASTTPTMSHCTTIRKSPTLDESPTCARCHPMGVATPLPTPMLPTLTSTPTPTQKQTIGGNARWTAVAIAMDGGGKIAMDSGSSNGQWRHNGWRDSGVTGMGNWMVVVQWTEKWAADDCH
jgi:hypothetical protein